MDNSMIIAALRRLKVETGSLVCVGCGHEHSCSTRGCAIIREAINALERAQLAEPREEAVPYKPELTARNSEV